MKEKSYVEDIDRSVYDFKDDEKIKKLYEKFFAFDYKVRKILPFIYKAYGVKPDV